MHTITACPIFFDIRFAQEETLSRQIVELKQIVLSVCICRVERVNEPCDFIPLSNHNIADIEVSVDQAGIFDFFGKYYVEFLPSCTHGKDDFFFQLSCRKIFFGFSQYLCGKRTIVVEPAIAIGVHRVAELVVFAGMNGV